MKTNTSIVNQADLARTVMTSNRTETMEQKELRDLRSDLDNLIYKCKNKSLSNGNLNEKINEFMNKIASIEGEAKNILARPRAQLDNVLKHSKDYVQHRPGRSIGYSVLVGVLMGMLMVPRSYPKSMAAFARASNRRECKDGGATWCWCKEGVDGRGVYHKNGFCCNTEEEPCICEE